MMDDDGLDDWNRAREPRFHADLVPHHPRILGRQRKSEPARELRCDDHLALPKEHDSSKRTSSVRRLEAIDRSRVVPDALDTGCAPHGGNESKAAGANVLEVRTNRFAVDER